MTETVSGTPLRPTRVSLSVPALYRTVGEERWHKGRTENISKAGVLLRGIRLFSQSARVEIVLTLPAGIVPDAAGELFFVGTVARLLPPPWSGGLPGIAIAFEKYRSAQSADTARPDDSVEKGG
jgi:hypothetical protein